MPDLTLVMPYFENPSMLALQYEGWLGWVEKRKSRLKVILVDDGSENAPAATVARPSGLPALEIYRVLENRPWHQHAARNLGADQAGEGWLLLTDMDHVLPEQSFRALLKRIDRDELNMHTVYMLDRIEADSGEPTTDLRGNRKPHPNSFVLTRDLYWRIGGYDEEFRGYGTDGLFKERAFKIAKRGFIPVPLVRYWRELVPDASTTSLGRKVAEFRCDKAATIQKKLEEGRENDILTLDFPWERVL